MSSDDKSVNSIKFLKQDLIINSDSVYIRLYLSQIEMMERMHGQGLQWAELLKNNYSLRPSDDDLYKKIVECISNYKRSAK